MRVSGVRKGHLFSIVRAVATSNKCTLCPARNSTCLSPARQQSLYISARLLPLNNDNGWTQWAQHTQLDLALICSRNCSRSFKCFRPWDIHPTCVQATAVYKQLSGLVDKSRAVVLSWGSSFEFLPLPEFVRTVVTQKGQHSSPCVYLASDHLTKRMPGCKTQWWRQQQQQQQSILPCTFAQLVCHRDQQRLQCMGGVGKQFHVTSPHSLLQLRLCVYQNQRRILCMGGWRSLPSCLATSFAEIV